jgi:hypothetical protein
LITKALGQFDLMGILPALGFGGDTAAALRTIKAPTLLLVPNLDLYNPVEDAVEAAGPDSERDAGAVGQQCGTRGCSRLLAATPGYQQRHPYMTHSG